MITIAMSTVVGAERESVWHSLTSPHEIIRWDERLVELLEPANGYPNPGSEARWRYRLGAVPVVLSDRPLETSPFEFLRSSLAVGLLRFSATHTLGVEEGDPERTKLALKLVASNSVPVVGGALDRFDVRRIASEFVDGRLRAVQKWCETTRESFRCGDPRSPIAPDRRSGSA